jgi:hypothetical protein
VDLSYLTKLKNMLPLCLGGGGGGGTYLPPAAAACSAAVVGGGAPFASYTSFMVWFWFTNL